MKIDSKSRGHLILFFFCYIIIFISPFSILSFICLVIFIFSSTLEMSDQRLNVSISFSWLDLINSRVNSIEQNSQTYIHQLKFVSRYLDNCFDECSSSVYRFYHALHIITGHEKLTTVVVYIESYFCSVNEEIHICIYVCKNRKLTSGQFNMLLIRFWHIVLLFPPKINTSMLRNKNWGHCRTFSALL